MEQNKGNLTRDILYTVTLVLVALRACDIINWHWAIILIPLMVLWFLTLLGACVIAGQMLAEEKENNHEHTSR